MRLLFITFIICIYSALSQEIVLRERFMPEQDTVIHVSQFISYEDSYYILADRYDVYKMSKTDYSDIQFITKFDCPEKKSYFPFFNNLIIKNDTLTLFRLNTSPPLGIPEVLKYGINGELISKHKIDTNIYNPFGGDKKVVVIDENNFAVYFNIGEIAEFPHCFVIYRDDLTNNSYIEIDDSKTEHPIEKVYDFYYENGKYKFSGIYKTQDSTKKIFFLEFDDNGKKTHESYITLKKNFEFKYFKRYNDVFCFIGQDSSGKKNEYGELPVPIALIITDINGNIINEGSISFDIYNSIYPHLDNNDFNIRTKDGGFIFPLFSTIYHPEDPEIFVGEAMDSYLVKTDSAGNIEWSQEIRTKYRRDAIDYIYDEGNGYFTVFNEVGSNLHDPDKHLEIIRIKAPSTGVTDYKTQPDFAVYPNPAKDRIMADLSEIFTGSRIKCEIFDINGIKRFEKYINESQAKISTQELSAGTYFIKFTSDGNIYSRKFVKE